MGLSSEGMRRVSTMQCSAARGREPWMVPMGTKLPSQTEEWQRGVVLLVDKPSGWTSFDVCARVRRLVRVKKVGHAGTLDPMATGLLIICVGKATKRVESYQAMEKEYTGTLRLGQATASLDKEEPVCEELPWEHLKLSDLRRAASQLTGSLTQKPPMYSALSVNGQRLYQAARKGLEVERKARSVLVNRFDVSWEDPKLRDVDFRIVCSKGTYVRVLADDLGRNLDTRAHLVALRRERIGDFHVNQAWDLKKLADACRTAGISDEGDFVPKRLRDD